MVTITKTRLQRMLRISLFASLGLDLPQVELELLALQHVTVGSPALSGTGGDGGQHTTSHELISQSLLDLGVPLSLLVLLLGLLGPLLVEDCLLGVGQLGALLPSQGQSVVSLVPLSEGSSIDNNDGVLHQSLGPHQLVVGGVVDDINDPGLPGDSLTWPGEIALVQPQSPVLLVAAPHSQSVNPLGSHLGHGSRPGQLELPLLTDGSLLASGCPALMPVISRDTHPSSSCRSESSNIS